MVSTGKSYKIIYKTISLFIIINIVLLSVSPVFARENLWSDKFPQDIKWQKITSLGVIIGGTEEHLLAIDGKTGNILWTKDHVSIRSEQVWPIEGTDVILINDQEKKLGGITGNSSLYAIELMSGDVIWSSSIISGRPLDAVPLLDKLSILYITDRKYLDTNTLSKSPALIPHMYMISINTGQIKWEKDFEKEIQGTKVKDDWLGYKTYNISGYHRPRLVGDELYLFYNGITKIDTETGQTIWKTEYPSSDLELIKTDADPLFTEKVIYTSGKGQVKAIDRATGTMIWDSYYLGVVPLLLMENNIIWAQKGGYFYYPEGGDWLARGPYGVTALDANTGKILWDYKDCKGSLANMLLFQDKLILGDKNNITALDKTTGNKIYVKDVQPQSPMFAFINSHGNLIFRYHMTVASYDPNNGIKQWESTVNEPSNGVNNTPFRLTAGLFLGLLTGGTGLLLFGTYIIVNDFILEGESAMSSRLREQYKAEQYYWQNVKSYRDSPALREAETIRAYRLSLAENRKDRDPYIYLEGQLADRPDFIGVVGINTTNGNVDRGVFLGDVGERYLIDYVEELLFHFDDENVNCYNLVPR